MNAAAQRSENGWVRSWLLALFAAFITLGVSGLCVWAGWATTCLFDIGQRLARIETQVTTHIQADAPRIADARAGNVPGLGSRVLPQPLPATGPF